MPWLPACLDPKFELEPSGMSTPAVLVARHIGSLWGPEHELSQPALKRFCQTFDLFGRGSGFVLRVPSEVRTIPLELIFLSGCGTRCLRQLVRVIIENSGGGTFPCGPGRLNTDWLVIETNDINAGRADG